MTTTPSRSTDAHDAAHDVLLLHSSDDNDLIEPLLSSQQQQQQHDDSAATTVDNDAATASLEESSSSSPSSSPTLFFSCLRGHQVLLFFKILYFCNGLSAATWGRFGVIYYNSVCGLRPTQIGWLSAVAPMVSFLCMPGWGVVADAVVHSRKYVYLFTEGVNTACLLTLGLLLPQPPSFTQVLMCVVVGMAAFRSSGVLDAALLDVLGPTRQRQYGSIRLYTALSWGLGAVVMGYLTDLADGNFEWNFVFYGVMMTLVMILTAAGLPARSQKEQALYEQQQCVLRNNNPSVRVVRRQQQQQGEETQPTTIITEDEHEHHDDDNHPQRDRRSDLHVLKRALLRIPVILWLLQVIIIGTGMAMVDSFLFVYLQNDLQASTRLCGWTVGVTVLLELPLFYYSELLLQHLGHDALMQCSMWAYALRAAGYTLLTSTTVHWVLALEVLHGVTFAGMWIASVDFAATVAPDTWASTVQTALSASFGCLGSGIGSLVGGWVLERHSAVLLYRGMAAVVAVVGVAHAVAWLAWGRGHDAFLKSMSSDGSSSSSQATSSPFDERANWADTLNDDDDAQGEANAGINIDTGQNNGAKSSSSDDDSVQEAIEEGVP